jgi:hypothetical protein
MHSQCVYIYMITNTHYITYMYFFSYSVMDHHQRKVRKKRDEEEEDKSRAY